MARWILRFLAESVLAYVGGFFLAFPLNATVFIALDWISGGSTHRWLNFILYAPVLAAFWGASVVMSAFACLLASRKSNGGEERFPAGEWVWLIGAVVILFAFFSERSLGQNWQRQAVYDLFVNHDEIGNLATAPFYMGIAYSLTSSLLRRRAKRGRVASGV